MSYSIAVLKNELSNLVIAVNAWAPFQTLRTASIAKLKGRKRRCMSAQTPTMSDTQVTHFSENQLIWEGSAAVF